MLRPRSLSTGAAYEDYFRYTSGRWLHDEQRHQRLRYQRFNVDALKCMAMKSVKADGVDSIYKLGEGRCNKAFRVQLTNGRQVIARIPTPLSGPQHLVTASEVATMRFLRERLGLNQVPRILSSSSRASETPVGAEFIIMDVADGIELHTVWPRMSMRQKIHLVHQWFSFESKIIDAFSGGGYGSLYYRKDIPVHLSRDVFLNGTKDDEFVLGPCTQQVGYWEDRYGSPTDIDLDRGPWADVSSYLASITNCERTWIAKYAKAPAPKFVAPWVPPPHLQIPEDHIALLNAYDKIAKYFIPRDERLNRPCFTLHDSNPGNIFLSREAFERDGTVEISAVIDWQHTAILPLYLTAHIPRFINSANPEPGQKEEDFEKEQAYLQKAYHALYFETNKDVVWASALALNGNVNMTQRLPRTAQVCWASGYPYLKRQLVRTMLEWQQIAEWQQIDGSAVECPISFSEQDVAQVPEDVRAWEMMEDARWDLEKRIGVELDGWVEPEDFERALQTNNRLCDEWETSVKVDNVGVTDSDIEGVWPFAGNN
ncbi:hypothetical protein DFP72DRAFT_903590 [Ephemerocybe angulata]|uniref:Aminoglycoside phosphotransferase domain-containing protein n=1 Tax=Ephemerocybe angulata TaxID=980116 RepID=A0A8H6M4G2_9AGAR|nr:hypothetical protein DFP72DRAFT_903590 [Tulosesus angulatus]